MYKIVEKLFNSCAQKLDFSRLYTSIENTRQQTIFFIQVISSGFSQKLTAFKQPISHKFDLVSGFLCTVSTNPTKTTKLYKGIN